MPGENLTHAEARERASVVQTKRYEVELDLTTGPEVFRTRTTVRFTGTAGASTFIDAITRTVHAVELNGVSLDPATVSDGIRIQLPSIAADNVLVIDADMVYMNTGEGLHRFVDPADGQVYLYSQFEVPDSRRMFPVFEQPDLKAAVLLHRRRARRAGRWSRTPPPRLPASPRVPAELDERRSRHRVWQFGPDDSGSRPTSPRCRRPLPQRPFRAHLRRRPTIPLGVCTAASPSSSILTPSTSST